MSFFFFSLPFHVAFNCLAWGGIFFSSYSASYRLFSPCDLFSFSFCMLFSYGWVGETFMAGCVVSGFFIRGSELPYLIYLRCAAPQRTALYCTAWLWAGLTDRTDRTGLIGAGRTGWTGRTDRLGWRNGG
ncbi:hypothetical protein BO71DRAFT_147135 [Aspergillus ellipticus CBS 707.79]|uniref:Uncharacterized protein n=1 Tax=Aspergillus ellipticus CBS 707.79 TaxID=1448320 RepID=A0A319CTX0_9EURO|nr:hypothetical protein BO71DRAFT_147135 [Aspergillus ellipticus CBS 707.79]